MTLSHRRCLQRLTVFGLKPDIADQIIRHINNMISNNGPEWTINRLKDMKISYINYLSGKIPEWKWIKTRSGYPTGPIRNLFRLRKPAKVISSLMVYTDLVSPRVTERQWKKFHSSVIHEREYPLNLFERYENIFQTKQPLELADFNRTHVMRSVSSSGRRSPSWSHSLLKTVQHSAVNTMKSFNHMKARRFINKYYQNGLPTYMKDRKYCDYSDINCVMHSLKIGDAVGRISFIQEPGFKLRAVANPLPCFQILLDPLKDSLLNVLKRIPNDYTHRQDDGIENIRSWLVKGDTLSSIDLSDATNNLPLRDQMSVLRMIYGNHPLVTLFEDVSTSPWKVDSPTGEAEISWKTGQPLGLGPSFPCFALYHHFIMRYVIANTIGDFGPLQDLLSTITDRMHNPFKYSKEYAIVGDDIVMKSLYQEEYLKTMEALECAISFDKCIFESNKAAEFCSRIIMPNSVIRQYKWKIMKDDSFLDFAKMLGPKSLPLFRPKQQAVLKKIGFIPSSLGGPVGWNPEGLCLHEREAKYWRIAELLKDENPTVKTVHTDEIHYRLKRDLGLINPTSHNWDIYSVMSDGVEMHRKQASVADSTLARQRFAKEMWWSMKHDVLPRAGILNALYHGFGHDYTSVNLTETEISLLRRVHAIVEKEDISWNDKRLDKLYSIFCIDSSNRR